VRWGPSRRTKLQPDDYIFAQGRHNSSHLFSWHGRLLIDLGVLDMRPIYSAFAFCGPHSAFAFYGKQSGHTRASAYIWPISAQPKFYSVRQISSHDLRGSSTWCAITCSRLLHVFRTCYRITQTKHIRLWKNKCVFTAKNSECSKSCTTYALKIYHYFMHICCSMDYQYSYVSNPWNVKVAMSQRESSGNTRCFQFYKGEWEKLSIFKGRWVTYNQTHFNIQCHSWNMC
jgi:hypothetical protein